MTKKQENQQSDAIKILCVEDEIDIRENIVDILKDEGFEVIGAENGKIGFEKFLKENPDIIISDIMMPEIDGYGLLKLIRESKNVRNQTIPFIFLSALGQKDDIIKGIDKTANDYLIKPIDFDLLVAKVREKTTNLVRIRQSHGKTINNIKEQIATVLPSQLTEHVDSIIQIAGNLKDEPFGPLPHRAYLENINRIYLESLRLKTLISGSLDGAVIDARIKANEEIFTISAFIAELISSFNKKIQQQIKFEPPFDEESLPRIKADKLALLESTRKIIAKLLKMSETATITISTVINHLNQIAIIFYFDSSQEVKNKFPVNSINDLLQQQDCHVDLKIQDSTKQQIIFTIPEYKTVGR